MKLRAIIPLLLAGMCVSLPSWAEDLTQPSLGTPAIIRPHGAPTGAVVLFSGSAGWGREEGETATALAERGLVVMGIDIAAAAKRMAASKDKCITVIGEIEAISHTVQRELGASAYHFPVLAGMGQGGTFALAVAEQTVAATIDRVVAVDPLPPSPVGKPLCTVGPRQQTPFPIETVRTQNRGTAGDTLLAALARKEKAATADDLGDLPLIELAVDGPTDRFAIFYSGDGGWRDLDKDLATILQRDGLPVVGIDVLRYFWKKRTPEQSAFDLSRIIRAYQNKWKAKQVVLIGFSFGADVLPPLFNRLSADDRAAMVQMSLLGMSATADFEVTVAEWLDSKSKNSLPVIPEAKRIDPRRLQCFYGREDEDAACPQLDGSGAEIIATGGGHHFDGNYSALARTILNGIKRRRDL